METGTMSVYRLLANQLGILVVILCRGELYQSQNIGSRPTTFRWNYLLRIKVCNVLDGKRHSGELHRLESYPRDAFPRSAIGIQAWGP